MREQCLTCKYYITQEDDCEKDYPEVCLEKYECGEYEPRFSKPECKSRYEDCQDCVSGCTYICRTAPSKLNCPFTYKCSIDRWPCDEQCGRHQTRRELSALQDQISRVSQLAVNLRKAVADGILTEAEGMPAIAALCRTQAELGIRIEGMSKSTNE